MTHYELVINGEATSRQLIFAASYVVEDQ